MSRLIHKPNYKKPWDAADDVRLRDMLKVGSTIPDIANALGRSQEAVRNRAWKQGLLTSTRNPRLTTQ